MTGLQHRSSWPDRAMRPLLVCRAHRPRGRRAAGCARSAALLERQPFAPLPLVADAFHRYLACTHHMARQLPRTPPAGSQQGTRGGMAVVRRVEHRPNRRPGRILIRGNGSSLLGFESEKRAAQTTTRARTEDSNRGGHGMLSNRGRLGPHPASAARGEQGTDVSHPSALRSARSVPLPCLPLAIDQEAPPTQAKCRHLLPYPFLPLQ